MNSSICMYVSYFFLSMDMNSYFVYKAIIFIFFINGYKIAYYSCAHNNTILFTKGDNLIYFSECFYLQQKFSYAHKSSAILLHASTNL